MTKVIYEDVEVIDDKPEKAIGGKSDLLTIALLVLLAAAIAYLVYLKNQENNG